jgi:predicted nuclease with TOPRIM domain
MSPTSYRAAPPRDVVEALRYKASASLTTSPEMLRINAITMLARNKKTQLAVEALQAEIAALRAEMSEQMTALVAERETARSTIERLAGIEARVSGMGSELSRQLHELGTEIEELSQRAEDSGVVEMMDALKTTQVRLANEQARYEITFRQDLAALANKLLQRQRA